MSNPQSDQSGISVGSAIVAVALLLVVGAVFVAAIFRYTGPDDALKIIGGLSGIVGVITGAFVSYFFTRGATQTAQNAAKTATDTAKTATDAAALAHQAAAGAATDQQALRDVVAHLDPKQIEDLKTNSAALRRSLQA